jgi:hypothetical protein
MTKELMENHILFYKILKEFGVIVRGLYLPDRWVPHCTMDMYFEEKDISSKFSLLRSENIPDEIRIEEVGIVKYFPPEKIVTYRMKNLITGDE